MTKPEDALEAARRAAADKRAGGGYEEPGGTGIEASIPPERPSLEQLREWSIVEVDSSLVYSTRRAGAPLTGVKRLLLRLLRQYTTELEAQQTRFNVAVLAHLRELEERMSALEDSPDARE